MSVKRIIFSILNKYHHKKLKWHSMVQKVTQTF